MVDPSGAGLTRWDDTDPRFGSAPPALATSGGAVLFAGGTVIVAMAALTLTGIGMLASVGLATSLEVLVAVAASLRLLPAALAMLGGRIDRLRVRRYRRMGVDGSAGGGSPTVAARPWHIWSWL